MYNNYSLHGLKKYDTQFPSDAAVRLTMIIPLESRDFYCLVSESISVTKGRYEILKLWGLSIKCENSSVR